jgi:Transcriptional regulator
MSRSIQQLEGELAAELFERRAHGMLLTDYGRVLVRRVDAAFSQMDDAREALARDFALKDRARHAPVFSLMIAVQRLHVFLGLINQPHMPSVAKAMGISQAAVSQSLREIENSLGLKLFTRSPQGMQPTDIGHLLASAIKRALSELRNADAEIASMKGLTQGHVTVGALSLGRTALLPNAIARLLKRHPRLTIGTVEGPFVTLASALRAGDLDFIVGALRSSEQTIGFVREVILDDVMIVVVRAHHPLAGCERLALSDLVGAEWVVPQKGTPTREMFEFALSERNLSLPRVAVETADLSLMRGLLLQTDMLTAVSGKSFQFELEVGALIKLPIALPETRRPVGVLRRTDTHPSPGARLLLEELRDVARDGREARRWRNKAQ